MVIAVETRSSLDSKIVLVFYVVFEIDPLRVASCIFHVGEPVRVPPPVSLKTIEPRTPELIRILLSRRRIGREREGGEGKKKRRSREEVSEGWHMARLFQLLKFRGWKRPPVLEFTWLLSRPPKDSLFPLLVSSSSSSSSSCESLLTKRATIPRSPGSKWLDLSSELSKRLPPAVGWAGEGARLAKHPREFCS